MKISIPGFTRPIIEDLIPCPYCCDGDPKIEQDRDRSAIWFGYCDICEASGPTADTIQDAAKKWNDRKFNPKHHPELDKIAVRLGKMNRREHDDTFEWETYYNMDPPYWRVSEIVIKILDDYDRNIKNTYVRVANLFAKVRSLLEDFDDDIESWEGPEESLEITDIKK